MHLSGKILYLLKTISHKQKTLPSVQKGSVLYETFKEEFFIPVMNETLFSLWRLMDTASQTIRASFRKRF